MNPSQWLGGKVGEKAQLGVQLQKSSIQMDPRFVLSLHPFLKEAQGGVGFGMFLLCLLRMARMAMWKSQEKAHVSFIGSACHLYTRPGCLLYTRRRLSSVHASPVMCWKEI